MLCVFVVCTLCVFCGCFVLAGGTGFVDLVIWGWGGFIVVEARDEFWEVLFCGCGACLPCWNIGYFLGDACPKLELFSFNLNLMNRTVFLSRTFWGLS